VTNRKATTGAGGAASNGLHPQDPSGTYVNIDEMKDVTYGDIVAMSPEPDDTPEIDNSNHVVYSELI